MNRHTPPARRSQPRAALPLPLLLPLAALALSCASCADSRPAPSPVRVTDTRPVGDGLKVIGFAMLGAAVVAVLGRMIR